MRHKAHLVERRLTVEHNVVVVSQMAMDYVSVLQLNRIAVPSSRLVKTQYFSGTVLNRVRTRVVGSVFDEFLKVVDVALVYDLGEAETGRNGTRNINYPLVCRASEQQRGAFLFLDKSSVNENVDIPEHFVY